MVNNSYKRFLTIDKILWCAKKKGGLQLREPNNNLAQAYLLKAQEALESMKINTIKDWKISTAYYTMYFSLYAILTKIGVKCELHACTIAFAKEFLKKEFTQQDINLFESTLQARIDSQYYVDRTVPDEQYEKIIEQTPHILVKAKDILTKLSEKRINNIREAFKEHIST